MQVVVGKCCSITTEVTVTACTLEGEFNSLAGTSTCLLPIQARSRDLELSLALQNNEAAVYEAIKRCVWCR